jgi:hypothetical protein
MLTCMSMLCCCFALTFVANSHRAEPSSRRDLFSPGAAGITDTPTTCTTVMFRLCTTDWSVTAGAGCYQLIWLPVLWGYPCFGRVSEHLAWCRNCRLEQPSSVRNCLTDFAGHETLSCVCTFLKRPVRDLTCHRALMRWRCPHLCVCFLRCGCLFVAQCAHTHGIIPATEGNWLLIR